MRKRRAAVNTPNVVQSLGTTLVVKLAPIEDADPMAPRGSGALTGSIALGVQQLAVTIERDGGGNLVARIVFSDPEPL
jgi:hypothetical protein